MWCHSDHTCLVGTASAASTAGGPQLPGVATPLVHVNGALQVLVGITRSSTAGASVPVVTVHLPQSDVPEVGTTLASVVADSVGVSTRFVTHDALAVGLRKG